MKTQEEKQQKFAVEHEAQELSINELMEVQGGEDADEDFECNGSGSGVHCHVAGSGVYGG